MPLGQRHRQHFSEVGTPKKIGRPKPPLELTRVASFSELWSQNLANQGIKHQSVKIVVQGLLASGQGHHATLGERVHIELDEMLGENEV
jgi:hypothetical protein